MNLELELETLSVAELRLLLEMQRIRLAAAQQQRPLVPAISFHETAEIVRWLERRLAELEAEP